MGLVSSVRWVAVSQGARVASQLVSMVVLARLLPPESYGLMAMAMTVTNLAFLFRDMGTSVALIQCKVLSDELKCTLYWVNVGLALAIALVLAACAPAIALAYKEPRLTLIIAALALAFPLSSLGTVHQALMERDSQFRLLARIEAVSAIAGLALALAAAALGAAVWSLVLQMLLATALTSVQSCLASPWRPRLVFAARELRAIAGFSANFSLFQYVSYLERNADSIIIGRLLGPVALGVYSMAYKVMLFPLQNITGVASRALFPAMSRRQESREELGALYLRATSTISMVTAPLMAGLFFLREPFVALALGPRWGAAAALLKWLAAVGFIQSITASTGAVFLALGKSRLMLGLGVFGAALQVGAFIIGVRWGVEGVAASYCVANLLNALPATAVVVALLGIAPRAALTEIGRPVAAAGFMLLALWVLGDALARFALPQAGQFGISVAVGALAYAFALLVLLRQDMTDMRALLKFG